MKQLRWEESEKSREEERRSDRRTIRRKNEMRDQQLHAAVARSTFRSENSQNSESLFAVEVLKKCRPL